MSPWYRIPHTDERMWLPVSRPDLEPIEDEEQATAEEPSVSHEDERG